MESVIWAFKQLYDKNLAYEGYRVLPYCWRDETPLSNHELRMDDDVYASRQDPSLTVGLRLETGEMMLIWTTTPWTLPSNLRSEEHTSELQSRGHLVCRRLLDNKMRDKMRRQR